MTLVELGYPRGKFHAVLSDARGWVDVLQDEASGHLAFLQLDDEGERRTGDVPIPANGGNAFPVLTRYLGETWLAWRDEIVGGRLLNVTTGEVWSLGWVYGNDPIAFGLGVVVYQSSPVYDFEMRWLIDPSATWVLADPKPMGRPTGIAFVQMASPTKPVPVLVDDARLSVPGMVNPQQVGRVVVGENADAGPDRNIARLDDGRECILWPGLTSNRPKIATDGGTYAIATWGSGRTRLALTDPAHDYRDQEADFAFLPDGTPVTGALRWMFGDSPSRDGDLICLHKNVGDAEWRRLVTRPDGNIEVLHWADASRGWAPPHPMAGKPDPGWWIEPAPRWALDRFLSGVELITPAATIVDQVPGVPPNRWTQRNRLFGLQHGGICVEFDPRFPGQDYDDGPALRKMYERTFNLPDGRTRFEEWVTPIAARRAGLPWGDRSMDVRLRQITTYPGPPAPPKPFKPCPRPLVNLPPKPEPPTMKDRVTFFREFREVNDFYAAEDGLQRPGGMVIGGAADTEAMAAWGYDLMAGRSVADVKAAIRGSQEYRDKHQGPQ